MAHVEVPHRLSDAIEAFKSDLNGCLHTSETLASLKVWPPGQSQA